MITPSFECTFVAVLAINLWSVPVIVDAKIENDIKGLIIAKSV